MATKKKYLSIGGLADVWAIIKGRIKDVSDRLDAHRAAADTAMGERVTEIARNRYHIRLLAGGADAEEFARMEDLSGVKTESASCFYKADTDKMVYDTSRKQFVIERKSAVLEGGILESKTLYFCFFADEPIPVGEIDEDGYRQGFQPRRHVTYLDAQTGRSYRWNGSDLTEHALFNNRAVTCDPVTAVDADECKGKTAGVRTFMTDSGTANMPAADSKYGSIQTTSISSVHHIQVFTSFSASTECWTRRCLNGTWEQWKKRF